MIYIIKDKNVGLCKIGYSCNPINRIKSFQINKNDLETILIIPGNRDKEKKLHNIFNHRRVNHPNPKGYMGNGWTEWFRLRDSEICKIQNLHIKNLDKMQDRIDELEHMEIIRKRSEDILYGRIQSLEDMIDEIKQQYMGKFWSEKNCGIDRDFYNDDIAKLLCSYSRYSNLRKR